MSRAQRRETQRRGRRQVRRNTATATARPAPRRKRNLRRWLFLGAVVLVSLLVIISFAISSVPGGARSSPHVLPRGQTGNTTPIGTRVAVIERYHLPDGQSFSGYTTTPPASGPHWPRWSQCGFFQEELPDEFVVHNMEHGNMVVSYNLRNASDVEKLRSVLSGINGWGVWGVARPYKKIAEGKVFASAWGVLHEMDGVDEAGLRSFFQAYAGGLSGSPERIPC